MDVSSHKELIEPYAKGEIYLKTPSIFKGYVGRPDLTAQVLNDDGFYHTGLLSLYF